MPAKLSISWLRYKNGGVAVSRRFVLLTRYRRSLTEREEAITLRGTRLEHLLSKRYQYEITVGANLLADTAVVDGLTNLQFMDNFWEAEECFIANDSGLTVPNDNSFAEVTVGSGVSPVEFIEGNKLLPSYTLTLIEKRRR